MLPYRPGLSVMVAKKLQPYKTVIAIQSGIKSKGNSL
jgi:hypothetical protein